MNPSEFYQKYFAYKYWRPSLQKMAYQNLTISDIGLLLFIFIVTAALINSGFIFIWVSLKILSQKGIVSRLKYQVIVKWIKALIFLGCLAALNVTNNLWVDLAN